MSTVNKLIEIALNEVGYLEKATNEYLDEKTKNAGYNNYTKYARDLDKIKDFYNGRKQSYSWCDVFVDWCFVKTFGVERAQELLCQPDNSTGAGVGFSKSFYQKKDQYYSKNPKIGDQIFFKKGNKLCHTGLVYKVDSIKVYTIEGNTSDTNGLVSNGGCVSKKEYKLTSPSIDGYGRPAYSNQELEKTLTTLKIKKYVDNVDYEGLNVRDLRTDEIVDVIPIGTLLEIIEIINGKAYLGERKYVYANYLSDKMPKLKVVTGADSEGLNVRKKRNTLKINKPISCLKNGTKVKVYGTKFGWSKISPDTDAWVNSKYLK